VLRIVLPGDADREAVIDRLCRRALVGDPEVEARARAVIEEVKARGDAALRDLTQRFEGRTLDAIEIDRSTWERRAAKVEADVAAALSRAHRRIARFHEEEARHLSGAGFSFTDEDGARLALKLSPLSRAGLYAPGGTAKYPSSVLMTAVPAKVAGVEEIVLCSPDPSAEMLLAAKLAGVDRVFAVGGAQAVAAMAYGTESVPRVDKIVGPGNAYVAAAKRLVFGDVDIDQVAGPSEVAIVADDAANAAHVAADLLAQAEHDADAYAILVTTSATLASRVAAEVEGQLPSLPRAAIAEKSLRGHGAAIVVEDLAAALSLARALAPEHLELHVHDARAVAEKVRNAGAIFVGGWTPEAAGDYLAGPNHVLPTGGSARFGSPLGVHDFWKRTSLIEYAPATLAAQADDIVRLARVEGLDAHGRAVRIRLTDEGKSQ
jgi:histidinol dehydrogenase